MKRDVIVTEWVDAPPENPTEKGEWFNGIYFRKGAPPNMKIYIETETVYPNRLWYLVASGILLVVAIVYYVFF